MMCPTPNIRVFNNTDLALPIAMSFLYNFSKKNVCGYSWGSHCTTGFHDDFFCCTFTGKEKDSETGYCYFGARYYDSDLSGLFLSVDPMADKYPNISPYAYCAWNPVKLVDPDGREFSEKMEEYAKKIEDYCQRKINHLTELQRDGELTEQQQDDLKEFQNTMTEIKSMRDDETTFYDIQSGSFGGDNKKTKGITQYYGYGDIACKGEKQHWIMVSLNTDRNALTKEGELSYGGLQTLAHELKHCYQFYNKESFLFNLPMVEISKYLIPKL